MVMIERGCAFSRKRGGHHRVAEQIEVIESLMAAPCYDSHGMLVALRDLLALAREEFSREEENMVEAGFPGLFLHRLDHEYLLKNLRDYIATFVDSAEQPRPNLCESLRSWLGFHHRRYDEAFLRYADWRRASGLRA